MKTAAAPAWKAGQPLTIKQVALGTLRADAAQPGYLSLGVGVCPRGRTSTFPVHNT